MFLSISSPLLAQAIGTRTADVGGVKLQYLTAGHGPAVLLLHGYAETSRMWRPLIPKLAENSTVIAPDLPGIGDSDIPADGLDMSHAAARIHELVKSLGIGKTAIVGLDIGLMVAYAYAAQFPAETEKLVLMDAFLPGVEGWEPIYNNPAIWHFRFNGPTPEALVKGRERTYFEHSGTTSLPTRHARFLRLSGGSTPLRTPVLAGCARGGPILSPFSKQRTTSRGSPKRS